MIVVPCEQGSHEWHAARCSVPTSSQFDRILTPAKLDPSKAADAYLDELVAGWLYGPADDGSELGGLVRRGSEMEEEAALDFAFRHGVDLEPSPFFLRDDRMAGSSPDRLAGERALAEIKCPAAKTHIGYMRDPSSLAQGGYRLQLQGQLLIAERDVVTICSYHPELPAVEVVVERDDEVAAALSAALDEFAVRLRAGRQMLIDAGMSPRYAEAA